MDKVEKLIYNNRSVSSDFHPTFKNMLLFTLEHYFETVLKVSAKKESETS